MFLSMDVKSILGRVPYFIYLRQELTQTYESRSSTQLGDDYLGIVAEPLSQA
jgi:hypothetical protein